MGVSLVELIEHISEKDFRLLLRHVRRCNESVTLNLTTPNYHSLWPVLEYMIGRFSKGLVYDQQHIMKYHVAKLRKVLESEGLKVKRMIKFQGFASFLFVFSYKFRKKIARLENKHSIFYGHLIFCEAVFK